MKTLWNGVEGKKFYYVAFFGPPSDVPKCFGTSVIGEAAFWTNYDGKTHVGTGSMPGAALRSLYSHVRSYKKLEVSLNASSK